MDLENKVRTDRRGRTEKHPGCSYSWGRSDLRWNREVPSTGALSGKLVIRLFNCAAAYAAKGHLEGHGEEQPRDVLAAVTLGEGVT